MLRIWLFFSPLLLLTACKNNTASLSGDAPVSYKEFQTAFPVLQPPFTASDTNVAKIADTTVISRAVFTQFIPDSSLSQFFNPNVESLALNPVGQIDKGDETYLLATITQKRKVTLVAFLLGKNKKYMASLQLLSNKNSDNDYSYNVVINREPTFTISREKTVDNNLLYTKNGYAYDEASGTFIKVIGDSNEDTKKKDIIVNPIDTLPRKNKFSGDYAANKKNFISVRDGKNPSQYEFFVHFDKDNGDCTGQLKGTMTMRGATKANYQETGGPCVINFDFDGNEITLKEESNCGNHRGIKCEFDDTFTKKKESKTKKSSQ